MPREKGLVMSLVKTIGAALEGRPVGYCMDEVMTGFHEFAPGHGEPGRRPMEFRVTWAAPDVVQAFNPASDDFLCHDLAGDVTIEGLCEATACRGILELRYFRDQSIRYTFDFTVDDRRYHYVGEKVNILPWTLPWSHTTCFGRLTDADSGELVSSSVTFFRMRTTPQFLSSFRLTA